MVKPDKTAIVATCESKGLCMFTQSKSYGVQKDLLPNKCV